MRVIIAGSRGIVDPDRLNRAILGARMDITTVISGRCAKSPDMLGEDWAKLQDPRVPVMPYPADWDKHGRRAGMIRNCRMISDGEARGLIALWDGQSPGTRHMIQEAVSAGLVHWIDAACPTCGTLSAVGLYVREMNGKSELRATCRPCLEKKLRGTEYEGTLAFFDLMGIWGKHTLHVTVPRRREAEPAVPLPMAPNTEVPQKLVFGVKPPKAVKKVKKLTYAARGEMFA